MNAEIKELIGREKVFASVAEEIEHLENLLKQKYKVVQDMSASQQECEAFIKWKRNKYDRRMNTLRKK